MKTPLQFLGPGLLELLCDEYLFRMPEHKGYNKYGDGPWG
jgi:hypothetical protein